MTIKAEETDFPLQSEVVKMLEAPWPDVVRDALEYNQENYQAGGYGRDWKSPVFHLVRFLKDHPKFSSLEDGMDAWDVFQEGCVAFLGLDMEEICHTYLDLELPLALARFSDAWDTIKFGVRSGPIQEALAFSRKIPTGTITIGPKRRPKAYLDFVVFLYALSEVAGSPFAAPIQAIGNAICCSTTLVSIYRKWAVEDGYIVQASPHRHAAGIAAKYTFNQSKLLPLKGH